MADWLKGCEICNAGLCKEMDKVMEEHKLSERSAAQRLAQLVKRSLGIELYTSKQLRDRYRYYTGKKTKVYSSKDNSQEQLQSLVPGSEVVEIPPTKSGDGAGKIISLKPAQKEIGSAVVAAAKKPRKKREREVGERTPKESIFTDEFRQAFNKMRFSIQNAKMEKWKNTTLEAVLFHLKELEQIATIT